MHSGNITYPNGVKGSYWYINNNYYSLPSVNYGPHDFKAKSIVSVYTQDLHYNNDSFNINSHTIEDSDFSESISLNRYLYRIVTNLYSTPDKYLSIPIWENKYIEGNFSNYTVARKFTTSREDATYGFSVNNNILTSANKGKGNTVAYVKISFTLDVDTDLTIKARSYGESNYDYGIISEIDTSLSTSTTADTTNVKYSFKGNSSADWTDISYGTLSAGDHFFTAKYIKNGGGDRNDDTLMIELPESFINKVYLENMYLPKDISVNVYSAPDGGGDFSTSNEYEYDPYTGDFKVKIVGYMNIRCSATTTPLLERLTITPITWDTKTSVLTWDYSLENITYHIITPDGNEYTTTEKSFDFTGKLGEPSAEYKKIKIYAQNDSSTSGVVKISLIYNPDFNTVLFNGFESANDAFGLPWSSRGLNLIYRKDNIIYYIDNLDYKIHTLDINTGEYAPVSLAYNNLSKGIAKVINNKIYFCNSTFLLEYTIATKSQYQHTVEAYSKNFEIYGHYVITDTGYRHDLETNSNTRIIEDVSIYAISNIYNTSKILLIGSNNIFEYDIKTNTSTKLCDTNKYLYLNLNYNNAGYRNGDFLYLFTLGDTARLYKINLTDGTVIDNKIDSSIVSNGFNSYKVIDNVIYITNNLYTTPYYIKVNLTNGEITLRNATKATDFPENNRSMIEYNGYGYVYLRQGSIIKFLL